MTYSPLAGTFPLAASTYLVAPGTVGRGLTWAPLPEVATAPTLCELQLPNDALVRAVTWSALTAAGAAHNITGTTNLAWSGSTPTSINIATDGSSAGFEILATPWEWFFGSGTSLNAAFNSAQGVDVNLRLLFWCKFVP